MPPKSLPASVSGWLVAALLAFSAPVAAQSLPVSIEAGGNTATATIGTPGAPLAEVIITFDDASGLDPASLGVSAQLVSLSNPLLLARLPDLSLIRLDEALPLLVTIEPPAGGGLSFHRTARVEVHTHLLAYAAGTPYRLFKAPLNGSFRDVTSDVAPGSVRARGTTGGFSQFLVVSDLRATGTVIKRKFDRLQAVVDGLAQAEQAAFQAQLDAAAAAMANGNHAAAIAALDAMRARAAARAGTGIDDEWRAGDATGNDAGELVAGAETLKFSIGFLRDYGQ